MAVNQLLNFLILFSALYSVVYGKCEFERGSILRCMESTRDEIYQHLRGPNNTQYQRISISYSNFPTYTLDAELFNVTELGGETLIEMEIALTGILRIEPRAFAQLKNLRVLGLEFCGVNETDSETFVGLSKLQHLTLFGNRLHKILDCSVFAPLEKLVDLELGYNKIRQFTCSKKLPILILRMASNRLHAIDCDAIAHLPNLRGLQLTQNRISEYKCRSPTLEMLDLSFNTLEDINVAEIVKNNPKLKMVNIQANLFKCEKLKEIIPEFEKYKIQYIDKERNDGANYKGVLCDREKPEDIPEEYDELI